MTRSSRVFWNSRASAEEPHAHDRGAKARLEPKTRLDYRLTHHLLARLARLVFLLYGRWQIIGLENVPRTGGLLLAADHASVMDPPLGWSALYGWRRAWGIARDDLWSRTEFSPICSIASA